VIDRLGACPENLNRVADGVPEHQLGGNADATPYPLVQEEDETPSPSRSGELIATRGDRNHWCTGLIAPPCVRCHLLLNSIAAPRRGGPAAKPEPPGATRSYGEHRFELRPRVRTPAHC
jgi:hypothetical protein